MFIPVAIRKVPTPVPSKRPRYQRNRRLYRWQNESSSGVAYHVPVLLLDLSENGRHFLVGDQETEDVPSPLCWVKIIVKSSLSALVGKHKR